MRKEVVDLVEAARALKLTRTGEPGVRCVRIGVPSPEFPSKLETLQAALEAVDASGALKAGAGELDNDRMKSAIDSVFRWMKMQGIDTNDPLRILGEALAGKPAKSQGSYMPLPKFAPNVAKKKKKWNPQLKLGSDLGSNRDITAMTMGNHARMGADMAQVVLKMGAAAPALAAGSNRCEAVEHEGGPDATFGARR
jgi:hypothetical protein